MPLATSALTAEERDRLILEHLPQVRLIARRIHEKLPRSVMLDDLVSAGVVGLIHAVDNFDPGQQVKLRTYTECRIRGAILDSLRGLDWAPRRTRHRSREIHDVMGKLEQKLSRAPTEEEIAAEFKVTLEQYRQWLVEIQGIDIGGFEPAGSNEQGYSLLAFIADSEDRGPSKIVEARETLRILTDAIRELPPQEQTVLSLYFEQEMASQEIAQIMKLRLARVSQLKTQGLLRLRKALADVFLPQEQAEVANGR